MDDTIINGLKIKIKELESRKSDYWRGVRDGYISTLRFIEKPLTPCFYKSTDPKCDCVDICELKEAIN